MLHCIRDDAELDRHPFPPRPPQILSLTAINRIARALEVYYGAALLMDTNAVSD